MRPPIVLLAALVCLGLSGCSTAGAGRTWYSPGTWFSGSEARKVATVEAKVATAETRLLKEAQRTAHETQLALASAPASQPVAVATESSNVTVTALDQLAGPLTVEEVASLTKQVARLLSESAEMRKQGESDRMVRRAELADASTTIHDLNERLVAANVNLKTGFERENAVANSYRNLLFGFWALVVFAVLVSAGLIYVKFALGGIPMAMGRGLSALRAKNPEAGALATSIFDGLLNRNEQHRISKSA